MQLLLLHVRPRAVAAGLEIVVYSGTAANEEASIADMSAQGAQYAVPRTLAGLEACAADELAISPEEWSEFGTTRMALPQDWECFNMGWEEIRLDLLQPAQVRAVRQNLKIQVTLPSYLDSDAVAGASVANHSWDYARAQEAMKRQVAEEKRKAAAAAAAAEGAASGAAAPASTAAAAAAPQPDSDDEIAAKYDLLRSRAMAELQAALLAMLRQAVRYRGHVDFPLTEPAPAVPVPAGGEPMGDA